MPVQLHFANTFAVFIAFITHSIIHGAANQHYGSALWNPLPHWQRGWLQLRDVLQPLSKPTNSPKHTISTCSLQKFAVNKVGCQSTNALMQRMCAATVTMRQQEGMLSGGCFQMRFEAWQHEMMH
jgi:hypothetical protein